MRERDDFHPLSGGSIGNLGGIDDYREDLPNRVYEAPGDIGTPKSRTRLIAPIVLPTPKPTPTSCPTPTSNDPAALMRCICESACQQLGIMQQMADLLAGLLGKGAGAESSIWNLLREHAVFAPGRGVKTFWTPPDTGTGGIVTVPGTGSSASSIVDIASVTIPEGYEGTLMRLGFSAVPASANDSLKWQLRIGDQAQPLLGSGFFYDGYIADPQPFWLEVPSGKKLSIVAINQTATLTKATGILIGFMKPLHNP